MTSPLIYKGKHAHQRFITFDFQTVRDVNPMKATHNKLRGAAIGPTLFIGAIVLILILWPQTWLAKALPTPFMITLENQSPYYKPVIAKVTTGTSITWHNPTPTHHTITYDGCSPQRQCAFDSGAIPPNGSYTLKSLPPGRYSYHCNIHPIMRGNLVVTSTTHPSESI